MKCRLSVFSKDGYPKGYVDAVLPEKGNWAAIPDDPEQKLEEGDVLTLQEIYDEESKDEWQPFGTHPMDGTFFLAANVGGKMKVINQPPNCAFGIWHKFDDRWVGSSMSLFKPVIWTHLPQLP